MPLILPGNVGSATAATGYDVANSCRFDDGDNARISKTFSSAGNSDTWTMSAWVKRSTLGANSSIFTCNGLGASAQKGTIRFDSSDKISAYVLFAGSAWHYITSNAVYRDTSAWYHIVVRCDTTQSTDTNRLRLYVNGTLQTLSGSTYPDQNEDTFFNEAEEHQVASLIDETEDFDGYMAEFCWIDGSSLAPDQFGEFDSDSGIWKPIDVSGLTFGTNGVYLDFEDSSDLGKDASGNSDWTATNLAAIDQSTDTCTNNSATIGTLFMGLNTPTFSEANLQSYSSAAGISPIPSSMGLSTGKWYAELKYAATTSNDNTGCGITMDPASGNQANSDQGGYVFGYAANGNYFPYQGDPSGSGATYTVGDIIGIYMDLDNMKLYFSKNGTLNSSTGLTINVSNTGFYYFCVLDYTGTSNFWTWQWNFGAGCPFAISSGNTDANGYGNFEYSPTITGDGASKDFFACNTKNLAEYGG